jgi:hypothetical protein
MKTKTYLKTALILASVILISSAFIAGNGSFSGPNDPVKLVYKMETGKSICYISSTDMTQSMDINGQTMDVLIKSYLGYKVKLTGKTEQNLKLEIIVDSLHSRIDSPQGSTDNLIKEVAGKTFNMVISPLGKVVDLSEASKIEYDVQGQGNANLGQSFANIFPDLPEKAVKPGDTWTKNDTLVTKSSTSKTTQIVQSSNKFESVEKVNGIDCAKITATIAGTLQNNVQNNDMNIFVSGPMQGTVTFYFALKEGYLVKQEMKSKVTGTVEISGPQSMSFPVTIEINHTMVAQ